MFSDCRKYLRIFSFTLWLEELGNLACCLASFRTKPMNDTLKEKILSPCSNQHIWHFHQWWDCSSKKKNKKWWDCWIHSIVAKCDITLLNPIIQNIQNTPLAHNTFLPLSNSLSFLPFLIPHSSKIEANCLHNITQFLHMWLKMGD